MADLLGWFFEIPPVTRYYVLGSIAVTAGCVFDLISPFYLYFSWSAVIEKGEVWRLLTAFLFFGSHFDLDFFFHIFFLCRYCRSLEENSFRNRSADFLFFLLFGATLIMAVAPLLRLNFLSIPLTFSMVYLWGRRNPHARMNFWGVFTFTAPYLPWVMVLLSSLLSSSGNIDLLGIAVGHVYYFFEDVYPRMTPSHIRLLRTPSLLKYLMGEEEALIVDADPQPQPQPPPA